jgi:hypothetical protein
MTDEPPFDASERSQRVVRAPRRRYIRRPRQRSIRMSQRFILKGAGVRVHEIAPPWVRTDLMNSREVEQAMPIDQFIEKPWRCLAPTPSRFWSTPQS